jgi:diguanylate cyclase (GGDEF)-like protein
VHQIREKRITDKRNRAIGSLFICGDVTEDYVIINRLERSAGIDAMTGLYNRAMLNRLVPAFDVSQNLPIGVLYGDLDNLKSVNDTMGHQQGDVLIRTAADALVSCCPPRALIVRIGGDEFVVLAPNCSLEQCKKLRQDVHAYLQGNSRRVAVSLSMGVAVKHYESVSLEKTIRQADANMFSDKNQDR